MKIEVLYFHGGPSFPKAMDQVKSALHEEGMDAAIETVPVENVEDALAHRFLGSPTIRVKGLDGEVQSCLKKVSGTFFLIESTSFHYTAWRGDHAVFFD